MADFNHADHLLHSAGYDAYITGLIFTKMLGFVLKSPKETPLDLSSPEALQVLNKLHLMRSDIPFLHMDGNDGAGSYSYSCLDVPNREHVFRITNFPATWKTSHIQDSFKTVSSTVIRWIDPTSAFVVLRDASKAEIVTNWCGTERKKKKRPFDLETYADYAKRTSGGMLPVRKTIDYITGKTLENGKVQKDNASVKRKADEDATTVDDTDRPTKKKRLSAQECTIS